MNILILSRNPNLYSTQSLVKAARIRNHYVRVVDHLQCDLIIEKGKPRIIFNNLNLDKIDAIIPRIGATATSFGAAVIRQFEMMGVFSTLGSVPLIQSRNKLSCLQILAGNGIHVPKTIYCSNLYTIPKLLDNMGSYPVIIKLIKGTQGLGVILAESKNNAESILEAFQTTNEKVILQKFVKESMGSDVRAFVVNNKVVGAMIRKAKPGEFRSNLHKGGLSEKTTLSEEEIRVAVQSAEILGLKIAGVDMLRTHHGPFVIEVNASPGLEGIEQTTEVDISGEIIRFVEENYS